MAMCFLKVVTAKPLVEAIIHQEAYSFGGRNPYEHTFDFAKYYLRR